MGRYDHRVHAGNAGDVWKHFLLMEAADWLLKDSNRLIYAESHAGRPHYLLKAPGEWQDGIGRIWQLLPALQAFAYFRMLSELNPSLTQASEERLYPGSARLIRELAWMRGAELQAEIWDNHPQVAASWQDYLSAQSLPADRSPQGISFHFSDGFSGLFSHLRQLSSDFSPCLLFIDPPYVHSQEVNMAERLLQRARDAGWIVLWWYMTDEMTAPEEMDALELDFSQAGLYGGRWKGAGVAVTGSQSSQLSRLVHHLQQRSEELIRMLKWH